MDDKTRRKIKGRPLAPDRGHEDAAAIDRRYEEAYRRIPQGDAEIAAWENVQAWGQAE